jgi:hypothetical protein
MFISAIAIPFKVSSSYLNHISLEGVFSDDGDLMEVIELGVVKALKNDESVDFITTDEAWDLYLNDREDGEPDEMDDFLNYLGYGIYLDLSEYGLDNGYLNSNIKLISALDFIPYNIHYLKTIYLDFSEEEDGERWSKLNPDIIDQVNDLIRRGMIRRLEYEFYTETDKTNRVYLDLDKKTVKIEEVSAL